MARLGRGLSERGGQLTLVTQNVDDLHERAGSTNVIHMHGALLSLKCRYCEFTWPSSADTTPKDPCPKCQKVSGPRPDIVWFGEIPHFMDDIEDALTGCDLFVSIGTSGAVYPAAGFVQLVCAMGKATLEINLEPSEGSHWFSDTRLGTAGVIVPEWVDEVLESVSSETSRP